MKRLLLLLLTLLLPLQFTRPWRPMRCTMGMAVITTPMSMLLPIPQTTATPLRIAVIAMAT